MPFKLVRSAASRLKNTLLDKYNLALCGILAVAAYLRLWNLTGLFNAVHDYDEGVYALGARFMAEGYMPYEDFLLAHPPLYSLLLSWVYRLFGYNFFYGKFLSVFLSLGAVIVIYLIGKRLFSRGAGLVAAAIMAVATDMVYPGRRLVQESLGIFLLVLAIYFAVTYFNQPRASRLVWCGICLGLAVATKYIFAPAALAVIIFFVLYRMGPRFWEGIRVLGRASFWLTFLALVAGVFAVVLALRWVFYFDIAIPFINPAYYSAANFAIAIAMFILPFGAALALQARPGWMLAWRQSCARALRQRETWLLLGSAAAGFLAVVGYFLIRAPQDFIYQTFFMQQERPYLEFPSLVNMLRSAPTSADFLKMAYLPILGSIPLAIIILRREKLDLSHALVAWGIFLTLAFSQFFYHLPRYYIAVFPFFVLGVASFTPALDAGVLRSKLGQVPASVRNRLLALGAVMAIFISLTITLLTNYTGYDVNGLFFTSSEKYVYAETISYLEQVGAKKVYAANAIYPALASDMDTTMEVDTFALIWLQGQSAEDIIRARLAEGVDYVVLDSWVRYWGYPYNQQARELTQAVRKYGRLVKVVAPETLIYTEIYRLSDAPQGILNGGFAEWVTAEDRIQPLGWQPMIVTGEGDQASITRADVSGRECLGLYIEEDGVTDLNTSFIYASVVQQGVDFPGRVSLKVLPTETTVPARELPLGGSIHFRDAQGHDLIIGFSENVAEATVITYSDGLQVLVLLPARFGEWSEYSVEIGAYWDAAGWARPQKVDIYLAVSADPATPGRHSFYAALIE